MNYTIPAGCRETIEMTMRKPWISRSPLAVTLLLAALLAALAPAQANPGAPARLALSQAVAKGRDITLYLAVRDAAEGFVPGMAADQLTATIGAHAARVTEVKPVGESGDGVAYLFLVDISKSLSKNQFDAMRGSLMTWMGQLGAADRAALISFGDAVKAVAEPTADQAALRTALAPLGPKDQHTALHRALLDGTALAQRGGDGMPDRRVIVTLTDGIDDRPGLGSAEEVRDAIGAAPVPIYAIGLASARESPARRAAGLQALGEFARRSGGLFRDAGGDLAAAFTAMRTHIGEVYKVTLHCADCELDNSKHALHLALRSGNVQVTSDGELRLLSAADTPAEPAPNPAPQSETTPPTVLPPATRPEGTPAWPWWAAAGSLLLALPAFLLWRRRVQTGVSAPVAADADPPASLEAAPAGGAGTAAEEVPWAWPESLGERVGTRDDQAAPGRPAPAPTGGSQRMAAGGPVADLRLSFIAGPRRGETAALSLRPSAVIGRAGDCDLVLAADGEVSSRHARLEALTHGRVVLTDLGSTNGTRLNGITIAGTHPLADGDLVAIGLSELRITFRTV